MNKWNPDHYKEHSKPQEEGGIDALKDFIFTGYEHVLDIGCGDGRTTSAIAKKIPNGNIIGIDPSSDMIAACEKNHGTVENMSFHLIGAEDISFKKQFDLIVSFYALHYVENHSAVLNRVYDALKPGGTLIIRMSGGDNQKVAEVFDREPWKSLFAKQENRWHSQHESDYRKILHEVGFSDIETKTVDSYRYMTRKELFDWSFSWVPYVTGLDGERSTEFTNELIDNICKDQEDKEVVKFGSPILYVNARKILNDSNKLR